MPLLPRFHVRPARGWLNDPNGVLRHRDRWHVFYQHNPSRAQHGDIAWGHVSSSDLVRWTDHPVAFSPTPGGPDRGGCWSGSSLPWLDVPAVVYTGIEGGEERSTVCVRTALDDDLLTWSEPVVVAHEPVDAGVRAMRDPAPFTWAGRRYALLGAAMTDGTAALLLFSADDPLAWRYEGVWLDSRDPLVGGLAPADVWECPQLVRSGETAVVVLSLQTDRRLEDVVHLVGTLTSDAAGRPAFTARSGGLLDHGPDFYAPLVVADGEHDPLLLGWVREPDAPDDAPPDAVAGCLTLPRRLSLHGGRVAVRPDPALEALLGDELELGPGPLPLHARLVVEPRTGLALVADGVRLELPSGQGPYEVWLDGPVVEVFRAGGVASTARGGAPWRLEGDVDDAVRSVRALALPG